MAYPEIEGRYIRDEKEDLIVGISLVQDNPFVQKEALVQCQEDCAFYVSPETGSLWRQPIRTAWIRCEGIGDNISVMGRGGMRVGRKISENAPCGINPAEVKQQHFRGER